MLLSTREFVRIFPMPMNKKTLDVHCHGTRSLPGQYTHSLGKRHISKILKIIQTMCAKYNVQKFCRAHFLNWKAMVFEYTLGCSLFPECQSPPGFSSFLFGSRRFPTKHSFARIAGKGFLTQKIHRGHLFKIYPISILTPQNCR